MVKKSRNSIKIPKEVSTIPEEDNLKTLERMVSTPQAGSPTTGNSGLVSKKVSNKPKVKRTIKKSAPTTGNNELRISQKRVLATSLSRALLRQEAILTKVIRHLADINSLQDPKRQLLTYGIESDSNNVSMKISYRTNNLDQETVISGLKKHFKDVTITPFSPSSQGQIGFYLRVNQSSVSK